MICVIGNPTPVLLQLFCLFGLFILIFQTKLRIEIEKWSSCWYFSIWGRIVSLYLYFLYLYFSNWVRCLGQRYVAPRPHYYTQLETAPKLAGWFQGKTRGNGVQWKEVLDILKTQNCKYLTNIFSSHCGGGRGSIPPLFSKMVPCYKIPSGLRPINYPRVTSSEKRLSGQG